MKRMDGNRNEYGNLCLLQIRFPCISITVLFMVLLGS